MRVVGVDVRMGDSERENGNASKGRIVGLIGRLEQVSCRRPRTVKVTGEKSRNRQTTSGQRMGSWFSRDDALAQIPPQLGLAQHRIYAAQCPGLELPLDPIELRASHCPQSFVGVVDSLLDPPGEVTLGGCHVQLCQPPVLDGFCALDEFFAPPNGFELFDPSAEERPLHSYGRGRVDVAVVGRPAECGA